MIPKSFGLLFYLKKPRGYVKGECPIYLRITMDGVMKEMSIHRNCDPGRWDSRIGRAIISKTSGRRSALETLPTDDPFRALNAYLDTLQAKVHEARHQLLMSGKPVTAYFGLMIWKAGLHQHNKIYPSSLTSIRWI